MDYRTALYSLLLGLTIATPLNASAAAVQAAETGVITHFPCPSFCGGPGARFESDLDGGLGFTTSFSTLNNIDGHGQAGADLNGPSELPVLRAAGYSESNSHAAGQAVGMQGFYYHGGGNGAYDLDVTLHGIANDPNPSPATTDGSLSARVIIFRDNNPATDTDYTTDYSTLKFEIIPFSDDLESLADAGASLSILADNVEHSVSTTLSISGLNTGDLIYVWASLIGEGTRGGFGDGFSTLTLEFQDPTGLAHEPAPVPLPATLGLLVPALVLLVGRRRRG